MLAGLAPWSAGSSGGGFGLATAGGALAVSASCCDCIAISAILFWELLMLVALKSANLGARSAGAMIVLPVRGGGVVSGAPGWTVSNPELCCAKLVPSVFDPSGVRIRNDSGVSSLFPFHQYA